MNEELPIRSWDALDVEIVKLKEWHTELLAQLADAYAGQQEWRLAAQSVRDALRVHLAEKDAAWTAVGKEVVWLRELRDGLNKEVVALRERCARLENERETLAVDVPAP